MNDKSPGLIGLVLLLVSSGLPRAQDPEPPLNVCATTPNLGAIVRQVGGEEVDVFTFGKPTQDPHFVRALPSHVRRLHDADLLVLVGLGLEQGWLPALVEQARNPELRAGTAAWFNASTVIQPLEVPPSADRSQGDLHAGGNPHFLVDPVRGVAVAAALAEQLARLRPLAATTFRANAAALRQQIGTILVGAELESTYGGVALIRLLPAGKLESFLDKQGDLDALGGIAAAARSHVGDFVVVDHRSWIYLNNTLGLRELGALEPLPGIPPSTAHLQTLIGRIRDTERTRALLITPYFDRGTIELVLDETGIKPARLAHQVGAIEDTETYVKFVDYNLRTLVGALGARDSTPR